MNITTVRNYEQLKVYFNDKIHLHLKLTNLIGFQSWAQGENEYFIEYYFSKGAKITTTYEKKEIWIKVLELIDKSITI